MAGNFQNCLWRFWEKLIMDNLSNGNGTEKVYPSLVSQSWIWKLPRTVNSVHVGGKYLFHQSHPWMPFACIQSKGKKKHLAPWIKGHKTQEKLPLLSSTGRQHLLKLWDENLLLVPKATISLSTKTSQKTSKARRIFLYKSHFLQSSRTWKLCKVHRIKSYMLIEIWFSCVLYLTSSFRGYLSLFGLD